MPGYTLRQLGYFIAIAESASIREAAGRLHVSESALTSALDQLEKVLKVQLCVRRKAQGVTLTPSGRHLAERARRLLDEAEDLESEAAGLRGVVSGPVCVGCPRGLAPTTLPRILEGVRERFPQIDVTFELGHRAELLPPLLSGQLDLVVAPGTHLPEGLTSVFLYDAPVCAVLPADHRLATEETIDLRDLADEPMVLLDTVDSLRHTTAMFNAIGRVPHIAYRSTSFELTRSLVGRGFGYSLQVQRPWGDRTYEGFPLVVRPVVPAREDETVVLLWPAQVQLSARAAAVVSEARIAFGHGDT